MRTLKRLLNDKGVVLKRALVVSFIVGSVLNLVNQWDCFFDEAPLDWLRFIANYAVPFCVSFYSGISAQRR